MLRKVIVISRKDRSGYNPEKLKKERVTFSEWAVEGWCCMYGVFPWAYGRVGAPDRFGEPGSL